MLYFTLVRTILSLSLLAIPMFYFLMYLRHTKKLRSPLHSRLLDSNCTSLDIPTSITSTLYLCILSPSCSDMPGDPSETDSLLPSGSSSRAAGPSSDRHGHLGKRDRLRRHQSSVLAVALFSIVVFILTWGIVFRGFQKPFGRGLPPAVLPKDPLERAKALLDRSPLIDGVGRFSNAYNPSTAC